MPLGQKKAHPGCEQFAWQGGYSCFSVEPAGLTGTSRYIASQEQHHRDVPFEQELRELLTRHGLAWDERHLWD